MARMIPGRFSADHDGDLVVFVIGMRINRPWKPHRWLPVFAAMPRMLRELEARPELGMLGASLGLLNGGPAVMQWWRSFEHLDRFARAADLAHLPAWRRFTRAVGRSGDVGIWHETYKVRAGDHESVYTNVPVIGMARATAHVPVGRRGESAAERLGERA
jgi:hypothetical protein